MKDVDEELAQTRVAAVLLSPLRWPNAIPSCMGALTRLITYLDRAKEP